MPQNENRFAQEMKTIWLCVLYYASFGHLDNPAFEIQFIFATLLLLPVVFWCYHWQTHVDNRIARRELFSKQFKIV